DEGQRLPCVGLATRLCRRERLPSELDAALGIACLRRRVREVREHAGLVLRRELGSIDRCEHVARLRPPLVEQEELTVTDLLDLARERMAGGQRSQERADAVDLGDV